MEVVIPRYFQEFKCIADRCPDSCCKEWAVDVDHAAAAYYRQLQGDLGECLREVLQDTENGTVMTIQDGRCPMWRHDGLCRIQAELGHDALCKTCRDFPRLRHDYGDFAELGLELSCPEAARLILGGSDHTIDVQTMSGGEAPEYDPQVMEILKNSRQEILELLDADSYALPEKLAILLLHAHSVQGQIDGGELIPFNPSACLVQARKYVVAGDMETVFAYYRELEILTKQWRRRLNSVPEKIRWTDHLRELTRYLICRYWLQAVSDYDLVCRVKLIVASCLMVGALGGDPIQTAQLFSKEIENDPDNVETILDSAYTSAALTDTNLLSLLLA